MKPFPNLLCDLEQLTHFSQPQLTHMEDEGFGFTKLEDNFHMEYSVIGQVLWILALGFFHVVFTQQILWSTWIFKITKKQKLSCFCLVNSNKYSRICVFTIMPPCPGLVVCMRGGDG